MITKKRDEIVISLGRDPLVPAAKKNKLSGPKEK